MSSHLPTGALGRLGRWSARCGRAAHRPRGDRRALPRRGASISADGRVAIVRGGAPLTLAVLVVASGALAAAGISLLLAIAGLVATIGSLGTLASRTPIIYGVVVAIGFLLLLAVVRAPPAAALAGLMNLVATAAAFGVAKLIFQNGVLGFRDAVASSTRGRRSSSSA